MFLELTLFAGATGLLADAGQSTAAATFALLVAVHYVVARGRVTRLLRHWQES